MMTKNKNYKLETGCGDMFQQVAADALYMAFKVRPKIVEFEFNGVTCLVNIDTDLKLLWRDYLNAHIMEWKEIGHDCLVEYPDEVKTELKRRKDKREEEQKISTAKYEAEVKTKRDILKDKISGLEYECINEDLWNVYKEKNKDPYGGACVSFALNWALLMQYEISKGSKLVDIAQDTSSAADIEGITGFMYGAAVAMLSQTWAHGEELRKWHNKDYGHEGDGVVNPAVLSIR